jgi:hypothetical protein
MASPPHTREELEDDDAHGGHEQVADHERPDAHAAEREREGQEAARHHRGEHRDRLGAKSHAPGQDGIRQRSDRVDDEQHAQHAHDSGQLGGREEARAQGRGEPDEGVERDVQYEEQAEDLIEQPWLEAIALDDRGPQPDLLEQGQEPDDGHGERHQAVVVRRQDADHEDRDDPRDHLPREAGGHHPLECNADCLADLHAPA